MKRAIITVILLIGFLLSGILVQAQESQSKMYRWVDERGVTRMSDNPPEDIHQFELGEFAMKNGDYIKAAEYYGKAVALQPKNLKYRYALANAYKTAGQLLSAIKEFQKIVEVETDPKQRVALLIDIGTTQMKLGEAKQAIDTLQKALDSDPQNSGIHFTLSNAYLSLNDKEKAIGALKKVILYDPKNVEGLERLANLLMEVKEDYQGAIEYFNRVIALDSKRYGVKVRLGTCYFRIGKREEGVQIWKKVIMEDPQNPAPYFGLGSYFAEEGQFELSTAMLERLTTINASLAEELAKIIEHNRALRGK